MTYVIRFDDSISAEIEALLPCLGRLHKALSPELLAQISDRFFEFFDVEGGLLVSRDRDFGATDTPECIVPVQLSEPFCDFASALRTLDRDLERVTQRHKDLLGSSSARSADNGTDHLARGTM